MAEERRTLRAGIRSLPGPVWILCAGSFVNRFGSFVAVFLVLYLREKGYSIAEAGFVVSLYGAGNVMAAAVGGLVADRLGRRNAIAISMFSSAATLLALSQADEIVLIGGLTILAGLTGEMYRPASAALLADLVPAGQRLPAFALNRLAINLGFAAGPATAGLLADRSFTYLFVGDALTSLVFGILALAALPEGVRTRRGDERRGEGIRTIARDRAFVFFLVSSILGAFVYFQSNATFPLHVKESGLSNADYGLLISLNGIAIVLLELPFTSITQRYPAIPTLAVGSILVGLGFALNAWAESLAALAFTVLVWTIGEIVYAPVASAYVADIAPVHLRGRYQGAWGLMWGLAFMLGPGLGAAFFAWNGDAFWLFCGVLGVLSAGLLLAGSRTPGS
ncbi:MAG: major facilitator superfamily permease, partial [Gaiellaceae bacterium]|nr:major facilitator superfamily permease [Gaiellaceae bacterium]